MLEKGGITQMNENEKLQPPVNEEDTSLDEFKKKPEEEEDKDKKPEGEEENKPADDEKKPEGEDEKAPEDKGEEDEDEKKKKTKHSLTDEEIEASALYQNLQAQFTSLQEQVNSLTAEIEPLRQFKADAERKEKQDLIDSFYMLSDADKASIVEKIDTYSLHDIEAELSILCVRNKVSFDLDDDKDKKSAKDFTLNLDETGESDNAPAWIKAVRETAKNM
jgi:hypothetical protein